MTAPEHLLLLHTQAHVELLDEIAAERRAVRATRAADRRERPGRVRSGLHTLVRRAVGLPASAGVAVEGAGCGCAA